jgi:DNA polymerase-3 subunit delta'
MSGAKVLIIHQADTMTESSANALLKTLEEPTANTFLLLTTDKPERILPTIKSRCEKLTLPLPDFETCIKWVSSQYSGNIDMNFAKLFATRPLALLTELAQEQTFTFDHFNQGLTELISGKNTAIGLATAWQEHIEKVLKWLQYWLREQFNPQNINPDLLLQVNEQAIQLAQKIQNPGINKILLLTELLTTVARAKQ